MANVPEPLTRMETLLSAILYCVSNGDYGYVPEDADPDAGGEVDNGGGE